MMPSGEIQQENLQAEVSNEIRQHFHPKVNETVQAVIDNDAVFVTGRKQIGKTISFIPELQTELRLKGFHVEMIDSREMSSPEKILSTLHDSTNENRVLILDETGDFSRSEGTINREKIKMLQQGLKNKGYKFIAIFTHIPEFQEKVDAITQLWEQVATSIGKSSSSPIHLDEVKNLPELTARRYLASLQLPNLQTIYLKSDVPTQILQIFPSDLGVLTYFRDCDTLEDLEHRILQSAPVLFGENYLNIEEKKHAFEQFKMIFWYDIEKSL
jgi:hypothetical protein